MYQSYHYTNYTTWDEKVLIEFNIFTFILGECILLQLSSYILKPGVPCEFNYSANYFLSKSICNFRVGAYILQLIALYLFTFSIAIWGIAANKGWSGEVSQDDEQRQSELVWILGHSTWQCSYCATWQWNDVELMERVVKIYLVHHLEKGEKINKAQDGFRPNRSCITTLIKISQKLQMKLAERKKMQLLLMDFSKAFDNVPRDILLKKLLSYNINGKFFNIGGGGVNPVYFLCFSESNFYSYKIKVNWWGIFLLIYRHM